MAQLPLVKCSDTIKAVSISGYERLTEDGCSDKKNIYKKYATMCKKGQNVHSLSLHEFFHLEENAGTDPKSTRYTVPHYVGLNSQPVYPITKDYARAALLVYRPWVGKSPPRADDNVIEQFMRFIYSEKCPLSVTIAYHRIRQRHENKTLHVEPVCTEMDYGSNPIDPEDQMYLDLTTMHNIDPETIDADDDLKNVDRGFDFDWSEPFVKVVTCNLTGILVVLVSLLVLTFACRIFLCIGPTPFRPRYTTGVLVG